MTAATTPGIVRFSGWISCRRDGEGPLGLILVGRSKDRPDEAVQVAFACPAPVDLPEALEEATVERLGPRHYRLSSGDRSWTLDGVAHIHREVASAFYKAVPPRPVPFRKRLFWRAVLGFAGTAAGRWLLRR
ncbi:MAG TPA: hypothetical protein VFS52_09520 [Steroidobacteraceae bacterium]|jgi:hypothetical protein|nr:hypothetical protein [Steroidobacteraceae bacterium]